MYCPECLTPGKAPHYHKCFTAANCVGLTFSQVSHYCLLMWLHIISCVPLLLNGGCGGLCLIPGVTLWLSVMALVISDVPLSLTGVAMRYFRYNTVIQLGGPVSSQVSH